MATIETSHRSPLIPESLLIFFGFTENLIFLLHDLEQSETFDKLINVMTGENVRSRIIKLIGL